ncbi:hypothetical protein POM88_019148 [Heracleum sosnowskyi]|uniref:Cation efflux protein transmembrane domain-containing protein n=1 Tax=Heracleum sosnowskyi TaxID=360622 RepID=A0AAD8IVN5_9APIA|nr:hypothetical protein POM88_019148 [Heracleum sosnowskyi]
MYPGRVDPQAPFQFNLSKISGSLAVDGHRHAQLQSFVRSYSGDFPQSHVHLLMANLLQAQCRSRHGLWLYCRNSRNAIVQAYAKDHYFDVVTNVIGLVAAVLGDGLYWWLDPIGAITLAVYTIWNWCGTVLENAGN